MKDFAQMNQVYGEYWGHVKPSRTYVESKCFRMVMFLVTNSTLHSCVAVKTLPEHTDVEIKCVGLVVGPKPKL